MCMNRLSNEEQDEFFPRINVLIEGRGLDSVIENVEAMENGIIKDFLRLHLPFNLSLPKGVQAC